MTEYQRFMLSDDREFWLAVKNPTCPKIKKIHGLKQAAVETIYKTILDKYTSIVKRVIIFGSATTTYCWYGSDLDICIDWVEPYMDSNLDR